VTLAAASAALSLASPALAGSWLPHAKGSSWVYSWNDSKYNPVATREKVTVKSASGPSFVLAWTTDGQNNPTAAPSSTGTVSFQEGATGLQNTDWTSNAPPAGFPSLCPTTTQCGNSLASAYYNVIWGGRSPVLEEPLVQGLAWSSTGGTQNDVQSSSMYVGRTMVSVPAFARPVVAAKIRSQITQAGALGDPYGSGIRTTWWVYGVGPVKVVFDHSGGAVTTAQLMETTLHPQTPPSDADWFPLARGRVNTYRWTNPKYLKTPVVEDLTVDAQATGAARFAVRSISGPIKVSALYGYALSPAGLTNLWGSSKAASIAKLPPLGPSSLPAKKRRHFFTPFDLMNFGFGPIFPEYPAAGMSWSGGRSGLAWKAFGVTGTSRVLGIQTVHVPAGTFRALAVRSTLYQAGFPFGSGTRTTWFAPGRGLVKLVFQHGDGTVSDVELLK
jgi:hypothetical protein